MLEILLCHRQIKVRGIQKQILTRLASSCVRGIKNSKYVVHIHHLRSNKTLLA